MKTKLFALIMAILCFVTAFASCDKKCESHVDENKDAVCDNCGEAVAVETEPEAEKEPEGVCEHADVDANKVCDNCGKAIVAIVEQIPAETEEVVDMVVNKAPEDANISDYIVTTLPKTDKITEFDKTEGIQTHNYKYAVVEDIDEDIRTLSLVDLVSGEVITKVTDIKATKKTVTYSIDMGVYWFTVSKYEEVIAPEYEITNEEDEIIPMVFSQKTTSVYTYSGEQIGETHLYDNKENYTEFVAPTYEIKGNEVYVTYEEMVYVISTETAAIIYTSTPDTLVKRPEMNYIVGDYGYVIDANGINVYDLTKWIECVYSYEYPVDATNTYINVLNGGDILVTYTNTLPGKSVNYDYIKSDVKYDIVYTVISAEKFEEKNVEFGYIIERVDSLEDFDALVTEKATAYNLAYAYPIVEGRVNYDEFRLFIVDNELNILCDITFIADCKVVGDGIFCHVVKFNDNTEAYELIDIKGEHIAYLPIDSMFENGFRCFDNKLYDISGKLVLDLSEYVLCAGTNVVEFGSDGFMILSKDVEKEVKTDIDGVIIEETIIVTEYKLFTADGKMVEIDSSADGWELCYANNLGYLVKYEQEVEVEIEVPGEEPKLETKIVTVYEFYNIEGDLVIKSDVEIYDIVVNHEDNVCVIPGANANMFTVK